MARKPNGAGVESRKAFGALLQWHLKRGTRPPGTPALKHTDWSQGEFSRAVKTGGAVGEATDRTIRNWCAGAALPNDLRPIERALFGPDQALAGTDPVATYRQQLRNAFHRAKNGVDLQAGPPIAETTPSTLSDPGQCFGRDEEITRLATVMLQKRGAALILGNAGHGKTMLTRSVGVQPDIMRKFGVRRWFAALEPAETAVSAAAEIAHAIGLDRAKATWAEIQAVLGAGPGLLVLDNLETSLHAPGQRLPAEQLLRDLLALPELSLMASLRSQETVGAVPWTDVVLLEPLPPATAGAMFLSIARTIGMSDPDLPYFVGAEGVLAGIPLAINLVAHRVFRATLLAALRREWERQGGLLAAVSGGDGTRLDSLPASVAFSLASRRLKPAGKYLFSLLGQLPAGLSETDCNSLMGENGDDAAAQLRSIGLLRDVGEGRIGLLPPIRDIAGRRYKPAPEVMAAWTGHYVMLMKAEGEKPGSFAGRDTVRRLSVEMPNIGAAISSLAEENSNIELVVGALLAFENSVKFTKYAPEVPINHLRLACARAGNRIGEAHCLFILAEFQRYKFRNDEAKAGFVAALDLLEGQTAARLQGLCIWSLAEIARVREDMETAAGLYPRALDLFREAEFLQGEADCLFGLGDIARQQDRYNEAASLLEQSNRLYDEAGSVRGKATGCWLLGDMARTREQAGLAQHWFAEAKKIYANVGYPVGEASCLFGFAYIAALQGEFEEAAGIYKQVQKLNAGTGLVIGEVSLLWGMADLARRQGDHAAARDMYEKALKLYQSIGIPSGQADCWFGLGAIEQAGCNTIAAREFYGRAIELFKCSGGLINRADCLHGLAGVARLEGDNTAAREGFTEALNLYTRAVATIAAKRCELELATL